MSDKLKAKMIAMGHLIEDEAHLLIETPVGRHMFILGPEQLRLIHNISQVVLEAAGLSTKLRPAIEQKKEKEGE